MRWAVCASLGLLSLGLGCSSPEEPKPDSQAEVPPAASEEVAPKAEAKAPGESESVDALRVEARGKVKAFAGSLKGELMAAMKEGGPTRAIEVCNTRAPAISQEASTDGWTLARRSDRLRNPGNQADEWEKAQLDSFASRMAAGEAVQELEHAEIVEVDGVRRFRYAKAIPLGGECLACHGKELAPEVTAALDARYPEDQARGYAAGELRGIFSLAKTLAP